MKRVRQALAAIRDGTAPAVEVLGNGFRDAPEVFIPGVAFFVKTALDGIVLRPENLPDDPSEAAEGS